MKRFYSSLPIYIFLFVIFSLITWLISNITIGKNTSQTVIDYSYWVAVPEEIEANRLIIDAFHKENPDILVNIRHHPWADYFTKLYTGIVTDTAPDVFRMSFAFLPDYIYYKAIEPLNTYIDADSSFNIDDLMDWPFEACIHNNKTMMMPLDCPVDLLYYNKDMFDAANVPYPTEDWTWRDLVNYSLQLKSYFEAHEKYDTYPLGGVYYAQFIMENGAKILDREKMICTINSKEAIEAIQFIADIIHKYKISMPPEAQNSVGGDPFQKEKCAMTYNMAHLMHTYSKKVTFNWDITYRPKGKVWLAKNLTCGLVMSSKSKQKKAAWRLMKFFVSETAQKIYAESGALVPIRKSVLHSNSFLPEGYKPANKHIILNIADSHSQNWICRNWGRFRTAIGQEMDLVLEGKLSPAEACSRAEIRGNKILDKVYGR